MTQLAVKRLKASGYRVYRPLVFFVVGGIPTDGVTLREPWAPLLQLIPYVALNRPGFRGGSVSWFRHR